MRKNALEWAVFGTGLVLVALLAGYLAFAALEPPGEARLAVRLGTTAKSSEGYRTLVTVENEGDATAMAVKVKVDDSDLDFDYVPRRSSREGVAITERPPKKARVVGWQSP